MQLDGLYAAPRWVVDQLMPQKFDFVENIRFPKIIAQRLEPKYRIDGHIGIEFLQGEHYTQVQTPWDYQNFARQPHTLKK